MEQTGVAIFRDALPIHIESIKTNAKQTHGKRLKYIEDKVIDLATQYPPNIVIIERGFSRFNTSTQVIYRVHGVVNKCFHNVEQIYYPPKTIKEMIVRGDATKKYVRKMIELAYPDVVFENEDQSDAFAIGLTYLIKSKIVNWDKENLKKKIKGK
jgi:Holliday junction resolvasome RuvABC endonuclease subunit